MNVKNRIAALLIALLALTGCEKQAATESTESAQAPDTAPAAEPTFTPKAEKAEIEWFEGSVEEAFALSKAENRPLFLYWGAVWCPPCVEIKQTVFKSPQFIAQTKLFIPVYLDGDTERAQTWGDQFGTKVYPTMIVFNPAGEEVTRLNAGIDVSAYNDVLGLSLENMKPTSEIVRAAMESPASLSAADFRQLAYYSWYDGQALPENATPDLFRALSEAAGAKDPESEARLYLQYAQMLGGATPEEGADASVKADPARVRTILESPALLFACWDYLIVPEQILSGLAGNDEDLAALKTTWAHAMLAGRHDENLSTKNQLYGWRPYLVFHSEGDEESSRPLPEDVVSGIRADGAAADESVAGSHARQSVINTLSNVYVLAGLVEDARALLNAEIGKSKTPYYFMGSLASLEEREGNEAVALEWRRKAYEASEGPATRIRWWASYVQALVRISPDDDGAIVEAAGFVFDPEQGMDEIFSGANYRNLKRATESLATWDDEQHADGGMLEDFNSRLVSACGQQDADSPEQSNCIELAGHSVAPANTI